MWAELYNSTDRMRRVEVAQNADGRLEAFGVAPDDTIWRTWQTVPGSWVGGWTPFYSPADRMRELRIGLNAGGRLEVFGVAPDDTIWHTWQDAPGSAWIGSWREFYSGADRMTSIDVGQNADGRLEVFGAAPDDSVWRTWQTNPGAWNGSWAMFYSAADRLRRPRAARNIDGRMEVFAVAPDTTVWRTWQPAPGTWTGGSWNLFYSSDDQMRSLEVGENGDGRLEVIGIAPDDTLWRTGQVRPGVWSPGWAQFYSSTDLMKELRVGRNLDGRLAVFGVSSDEQIWYTQQTMPGTWVGGWTDLTAQIRVLLKIVTSPVQPLNTMMANMRAVFATVGIKVAEGPRENITVIPAPMAPPQTAFNVGACLRGGTVTADQTLLFANRNNAGPTDLVVYFVTLLTGNVGTPNGCALSPSGQPGAAAAQGASVWTLAHEVAHALGLDHIPGENTACPSTNPQCCSTPDRTRLMTGCGTALIAGTPSLTTGEGSTMQGSSLIRKDRLATICVASNFDGRLEVFGTSADDRIWHTWQTAPNGGWNEGGG